MRNAVIAAREYEPSVEFGHRLERLNLDLIVFNELTGACAWLRLSPTRSGRYSRTFATHRAATSTSEAQAARRPSVMVTTRSQ